MKRLWFVGASVAVALLLVLSPVSQATVISFGTTLSGALESPPNGSPGTGFALLEFDTAAHTLAFHVTFADLTTPTTAAHLHCCIAPPGVAAVAISLLAGFPIGGTSGTYDNLFDLTSVATYSASFVAASGGTAAGAEAALLSAMLAGNSYLNIHTTAFPAGEIRGFPVHAITEPGTLALVFLSLMLLGVAHRKPFRA